MATDRGQAEASLKAGGFDPKIHWASGASEWQRGSLKAIVWAKSEFTLQGKHTELPTLLAGPALTTEETEALRWGLMQAQMHLTRTVNPGAAQEYDAFAKGFASLFTRMGAVPSPSTPETGEES